MCLFNIAFFDFEAANITLRFGNERDPGPKLGKTGGCILHKLFMRDIANGANNYVFCGIIALKIAVQILTGKAADIGFRPENIAAQPLTRKCTFLHIVQIRLHRAYLFPA